MRAAAARQQEEPTLVVYVARESDGFTFSLPPQSKRRILAASPRTTISPRVFVANDTATTDERLRQGMSGQLAILLTGLSKGQLRSLGGISFRDPASERELWQWSPDHP